MSIKYPSPRGLIKPLVKPKVIVIDDPEAAPRKPISDTESLALLELGISVSLKPRSDNFTEFLKKSQNHFMNKYRTNND